MWPQLLVLTGRTPPLLHVPIESIKLTTPLQDLDAAGVLRPSDGQEVGSPGRSAGTV